MSEDALRPKLLKIVSVTDLDYEKVKQGLQDVLADTISRNNKVPFL